MNQSEERKVSVAKYNQPTDSFNNLAMNQTLTLILICFALVYIYMQVNTDGEALRDLAVHQSITKTG